MTAATETTKKGNTMKLNDLTIGEARKIAAMFGAERANKPHPFKIGANYLIRTVTMIQTGRLVEVCGDFLVLEDAAWVADTGRFADALVSQNYNEVEPFPEGRVLVGLGGIIDACEVASLVREQK